MSSRRIYVASSWRNDYQAQVVDALRAGGHEVYDFRNPSWPKPKNIGFSWSDIDPDWEGWTTAKYREALHHPVARAGYRCDKLAMQWADCCVLALPSGRSSHIEAGWMAGRGKTLIVLQPEKCEPELMYKVGDGIAETTEEVLAMLANSHYPLKAR